MQHSLSGTSSCALNQAQDGICVLHFFQQGRPIPCSGTGLRTSKKLVRTPVPPPMDGPQRGLRNVESVTGRPTYGSHVRMICTGYWFSEQRAKAFEKVMHKNAIWSPKPCSTRTRNPGPSTETACEGQKRAATLCGTFSKACSTLFRMFSILSSVHGWAAATKTWRIKCCT